MADYDIYDVASGGEKKEISAGPLVRDLLAAACRAFKLDAENFYLVSDGVALGSDERLLPSERYGIIELRMREIAKPKKKRVQVEVIKQDGTIVKKLWSSIKTSFKVGKLVDAIRTEMSLVILDYDILVNGQEIYLETKIKDIVGNTIIITLRHRDYVEPEPEQEEREVEQRPVLVRTVSDEVEEILRSYLKMVEEDRESNGLTDNVIAELMGRILYTGDYVNVFHRNNPNLQVHIMYDPKTFFRPRIRDRLYRMIKEGVTFVDGTIVIVPYVLIGHVSLVIIVRTDNNVIIYNFDSSATGDDTLLGLHVLMKDMERDGLTVELSGTVCPFQTHDNTRGGFVGGNCANFTAANCLRFLDKFSYPIVRRTHAEFTELFLRVMLGTPVEHREKVFVGTIVNMAILKSNILLGVERDFMETAMKKEEMGFVLFLIKEVLDITNVENMSMVIDMVIKHFDIGDADFTPDVMFLEYMIHSGVVNFFEINRLGTATRDYLESKLGKQIGGVSIKKNSFREKYLKYKKKYLQLKHTTVI